MIRRPTEITRTDTRLPYTTFFRSPVFLPAYQAFAILKPADRNDDLILGLYRFGQRQFDAALRKVTQIDAYHPIANLDVGATVNLYPRRARAEALRSEEHTSELQSLMRISYAVFCLKKK